MKETFAAKTFASKTFASGNWVGVGVAGLDNPVTTTTLRRTAPATGILRQTAIPTGKTLRRTGAADEALRKT